MNGSGSATIDQADDFEMERQAWQAERARLLEEIERLQTIVDQGDS